MYEGQVYKDIEDINISSFLTKKEWTFISSSYDDYGIQIDKLSYSDYLYKEIEYLYYSDEKPYGIFYSKNLSLTSSLNNNDILSIGIPNSIFGEKIQPGTFNLSYTSNSVLLELEDDNYGNLLSGSVNVGNIFYDQGNIVINDSRLTQYSNWDNDSTFSLNFKGNHTIYEYEVDCKVNKNEFNLTLNKSIYSGSVVISDIYDYSNEWTPYITTVGLYNESYELLAVAKLAKPIKNIKDVDLTFSIRIDV